METETENALITRREIERWCSPRKILIATTLIDGPSLMLHGIQQAKSSGAEILLVHVIRPCLMRAGGEPQAPFVLPGPAVRAATAGLQQLAGSIEREGVLCEPILLSGEPAEQISLLTKSSRVDRVVVASGVHPGIERLFFGSLSEELALRLKVPVCIVGHRAFQQRLNGDCRRRYLVATSLRFSSALCIKFAVALAKANHADLTLLHVIESPTGNSAEAEPARQKAIKDLQISLTAEDYPACSSSVELREGDVAAAIIAAASVAQHELIIMGSPADSIVSRILGSSITHQIIAEATCPVMVVKSEIDPPTQTDDGLRTAPSIEAQHFPVEGSALEHRPF